VDCKNNDSKWSNAIATELEALDELRVFRYHPHNHKMGDGFQYAPLKWVFDVKKEDLRRKARLVVGGHIIDRSGLNTYSSVIQTLFPRLLLIVASNKGLNIGCMDIVNAYVNAKPGEKMYTRAGEEWNSENIKDA